MLPLSEQHVAMGYLIDEHLARIRPDVSPDTYHARERLLRHLHDWLEHGIAWATTDQLRDYLARPVRKANGREAPPSRWSRRTYTGHIKAFFAWATETGELDGDPAATLRKPRAPKLTPKPVTDAELALALGAPEPYRTAFMLAAYEGMRRAEISRCWREHITEDLIWIPCAKGGDPQTVPTHPLVWEHVGRRPGGPLVPLTPTQLGDRGNGWLYRHVGPDVHIHRLRHWYGTAIQRRFRDAMVTQQCLRHTSPVSTAGYVEVASEDKRAAVRSLPAVAGHRAVGARPVPPADAV